MVLSEYEEILRKLGSFGPYQRRAFLLVSMFETPLAWAMLTPILLNAKPDWYCPDWDGLHETLIAENRTDPAIIREIRTYDDLKWYQRYTNTSQVNLTVTSNTCTPDNKICEGVRFQDDFNSVVSQWKLICDRESLAGTITSIQMAGVLVGAVLTGQLADLFGRRNILFIEHAILVTMWFCSAFAGSWMVYAALRFIIGALIGGVLVVNFVLPLELVTPEWRTFCGCIGLWAVGLMALALWGYFIRDWQYLVIATSTASVFILLAWWFVPESPRWLLSKGRIKKAERILTDMAKYNKKPVPDFSKLRAFVEKERRLQAVRTKYSYWHLCSSWQLAKNSLILMYGWFVSSAVYYGLNFNTRNLTGDIYLNIFFSGLVEIPALLFVVLVHNKLGRRLTVSSLMIVTGVFCFSILVLDIIGKLDELGTLSVVLAMVGKAGISGGWAALQVFSAELFPTVVRNIGVGTCSFSARIGAIVAPQIVYLGTKHFKPLTFTVFGVISLVSGGLVWLLPETRGNPLQDMLIVVQPPGTENGAQNDPTQRSDLEEEAIPLNDVHVSVNNLETNGDLPVERTES